MPNDAIVRWENEGGAVVRGLPARGRRDADSNRERTSRASTKAPAESFAVPAPLVHDKTASRDMAPEPDANVA